MQPIKWIRWFMNLVLDCRPTFSFWQAGRLSRGLRAHDEEKKKLFFIIFFIRRPGALG